MERISRIYLITGIFAIAMGLLEATVVIYLRQLYYPQGFSFPLVEFSPFLFRVELLRELATLIMLLTVGILAGRKPLKSFAWFLYVFAVWDLAYYLGLKLLLDWPASWLTWDLLFLIPVVWVGPVIAPVICSLAMIVLGVYILKLSDKKIYPVVSGIDWVLLITGSLVVFLAFIQDYSLMLIRGGLLSQPSGLATDKALHDTLASFVPHSFNWYLFLAGFMLIVSAITRMIYRCSGRVK